MVNDALKLLNGTKTFKEKLPAIIEVFVQYYGEENREYIEERFSSLEAFCFNKPSEKKYIIDKTIDKIQKKYYESFLKKYDIEFNNENCTLYLPYSLSSKGYSLMERYQEYKQKRNTPAEQKRKEIIDFYITELKNRFNFEITYEKLKSMKGTPEYEELIKKMPDYLSQHVVASLEDEYIDIEEERLKKLVVDKLSKIDPSITLENFEELYQNGTNKTIANLDSMLEDFEQMKINFTEEIKPLQPYISYIEKCNRLKVEIESKALYDLIMKYKEYIPSEELEKITNQINKNKPIRFFECPVTCNFFGTNIDTDPIIKAFSKENEEILKEGKPEWKVDSIKYDRIKFFKNYGIDKGKEYNDYMNDPECKKLIPQEQLINEIINAKEQASEQAKIDFYRSLPDYKEMIEYMDSLNLESKDGRLNPNIYENTVMCICPNLRYTEDGIELKPLAFFRLTQFETEYLDAYIMHELNHVYELGLIEDHKEYTVFTSGWDIIEQPKEEDGKISLAKDKTKRNYELFNEIINELISQDIAELLHENGIYIFSREDNSKIRHKTSYEHSAFIIREFYYLYLDDIKESRRTRDMTKLFAKVGRENFDELNELFHLFNNHFNEFQLAEMYRNLKEEKETEDTIFYKNILEKRDEILSRMKQHTEEYLASQSLK